MSLPSQNIIVAAMREITIYNITKIDHGRLLRMPTLARNHIKNSSLTRIDDSCVVYPHFACGLLKVGLLTMQT